MCELEVQTRHSFTGRMCAGTRANESLRRDSLFEDPLAEVLAGESGMAAPMGDWILVPRTRFGDDFLVGKYFQELNPCRQLVLLGAGMDTRAFRMFAKDNDRATSLVALPDLEVFEVDQPTTFDVKEKLLSSAEACQPSVRGGFRAAFPLTVKSRTIVPIDFNDSAKSWAQELVRQGFKPDVPTVWLLEGLVYYLPHYVVENLFKDIWQLSAPGSGVFHDAVSASYVAGGSGPAPGGAPFISGSDDYEAMWRKVGHSPAADSAARDFASTRTSTFDFVQVRNFQSINVDRRNRSLWKAPFDSSHATHGPAHAFPEFCQGRPVCLFVTAEKKRSHV